MISDNEMVNSIQLLVILTACFAAFGQRCSLMCGPGEICAPVRYGRGPAVYDCITYAEAYLLQQAYRGGPTGPGTGFGKSSGSAFTVPVDSLSGQRFPGFQSGLYPNQVLGPGSIWIDFRSLPSVGVGVSPSVGNGAFPDISTNLPNDGVGNPAGVNERLRGSPINRNNTTNILNNMNMQGGGNGTQVNGETTGRLGQIVALVNQLWNVEVDSVSSVLHAGNQHAYFCKTVATRVNLAPCTA